MDASIETVGKLVFLIVFFWSTFVFLRGFVKTGFWLYRARRNLKPQEERWPRRRLFRYIVFGSFTVLVSPDDLTDIGLDARQRALQSIKSMLIGGSVMALLLVANQYFPRIGL